MALAPPVPWGTHSPVPPEQGSSLPPNSHNLCFYSLLPANQQGLGFHRLLRVSPNLPSPAPHTSHQSPGAGGSSQSRSSQGAFHHSALPQLAQLLTWVCPAEENWEKQSNFVLALN